MNNTDNRIHEHQTDVRTELWKDHIYYISFNPYRFPRWDGKGTGFLPLPQRFQEIITEFKEEFAKQKEAEKKPEEALQKILTIKDEIIDEYLTKIEQRESEKKEQSELGEAIENLLLLINHPNTPINKAYQEINKFVEEWKEQTKTNTTNPSVNSTTRNGKDWKKISSHFTPELVDEWIKQGFTYQQVKEWIDISEPTKHSELIKDYGFIGWLVKIKKGNHANPSWWTKYSPPSEMEKLRKQYQAREKKIIIPELKEIEELLAGWQENKSLAMARVNACHLYEDRQEYIRFVYQPPKGNFMDLPKFLWFRNNIFYETLSWLRINHENVEIKAIRSTFIHTYITNDGFVRNGGNGILTYYPRNILGASNKDEVCKCPEFLVSTEFAEFDSSWQPEYKLFKLKSFLGGLWRDYITNKKGKYPVFHTLDLEEIPEDSWQSLGLQPTTYFLLPNWYRKGDMTCAPSVNGFNFFKTQFISSQGTTLEQWVKKAKMERGGAGEHLLTHVHVNYFWNNKKINESSLDEMDWNNFLIVPTANPAGTMYRFRSRKVFFRYSEDLNFTLDADEIKGAALNMGASIVSGLVKFATANTVTGIDEVVEKARAIRKAGSEYLHSSKDVKSKDERQGERKKTLAAGSSSTMQTVMGSIPSLLDASHTHSNYSLAELALRFESIQFKIRLEFNKSRCNWYLANKSIKKSCYLVFNEKVIGDILCQGFIKMENVILEGDPDGYYAGLLQEGQYFYKDHPKEFFLKPLEKGEFERGILNDNPVHQNTTIQTNFKSAIGRDDLVHVDDMSWVWKDSYCRGGGADLFPQLINGMRQNIKKDDPNAWKFDGYKQGKSSATLQKGVMYEWYMHAFSNGEKDNKEFRGLDDGVTVTLKQDGADWELSFTGRIEITNTVGDPTKIGGGIEIADSPEKLEVMEDTSQTEKLDEFAKSMEAVAEKSKEQEQEEELNPEETKEKKKTKEQEEIKEEESDPAKTKTKDKTKDKSQSKNEDKIEEKSDEKQGEK